MRYFVFYYLLMAVKNYSKCVIGEELPPKERRYNIMALTRSFLKGMNLTEEQVSAIIEAHTETINGLKKERDGYKEKLDEMGDVQKELDDMKERDGEDWKSKYEKEHSDFEEYKKTQLKKDERSAKESALRSLLAEIGVSEKRIPSIVKVSDIDSIEFDTDGKSLKNADKLKESMKTEWSEFISTTETKGSDTKNPPKNEGADGDITKEQFARMGYKERAKLFNEHPEQYEQLSGRK